MRLKRNGIKKNTLIEKAKYIGKLLKICARNTCIY